MFLGFRKPLYSCREVMCHTSTRPGTSLHVTQAFLRVTTASDKCWVEKAWVQGYATSVLVLAALFSKQSAIVDAAIGDYTMDGQLSMRPFFFSANLTAIT